MKNLLNGSKQQLKKLFRKSDNGCGRIAIIGGGSWATALAKVMLESKGEIGWYMRRADRIEEIKRTGHNAAYLSGVHFDVNKIKFTTDINEIVRDYDTLIFSIPSPYFKSLLSEVMEDMRGKFVVTATKGIVPEDNLVISDYFHYQYAIPREQIVCLIGPSHAEEVAMNRLTYLTIGCEDIERAKLLASAIKPDYVQVRVSTDVQGIEYASVLKNIYAIGAGLCHGLQYGDNFHAVYMANASCEMADVLNLLSPSQERNITESVYLGDLLVTGYSDFSRNRIFGTMLGRGYSIKAAQTEMEMVAEGYYGAKCIHELLEEYNTYEFPIINAVYAVLYENASPAEEIKKLTTVFR